jgi:hypothetical protein
MATSTYLANPTFTVNSIDLTDQCKSVVFTRTIEALESTAFGATERVFTGGLGNHQCVVTLLFAYNANEPYATLKDLVGTQTTIIVKPTSSATSATNPAFTLTNTFLESLDVVNASLGELSEVQLTFIGGAYTAETS